MHDRNQSARTYEVSALEEFVKGFVVSLVDSLKYIMAFGDFWSVEKDFWVLQKYFFNCNVVVER